MYKTVVIGFTKDAVQRAKLIEDKANEMYAQGWEVVCVTSTPNCGAIVMFKQGFTKLWTVYPYDPIFGIE